MELGLVQQQKMQIKMTAELQLAISILQYSAQELSEFLKDQALENPLLEVEEYYDQLGPVSRHKSSSFAESISPIDFASNRPPTLSEYLSTQTAHLHTTKKEKRIINYIILMLDSIGYFKEDIEETADYLCVSVEEVTEALHKVKQLEPIGIGAKDLAECLLLQLNACYPQEDVAKNIVRSYLPELAERNWNKIRKELDVEKEAVIHAFQIIKSLNPKPAAAIDVPCDTTYIIPDLTVQNRDDSFTIIVNENLPTVKMSADYQAYLSNSEKNLETAKYIQSNYKKAIWLTRSMEHRKLTLCKVMQAILKEQILFFQKGPAYIKPLNLKDIAEICNINESTVSRATNNKYVQTPFGLFELKYFFSSAVKTTNGTITSSHVIKQMIKAIISNENGKRPFSDQQIAMMLKEKGILISRRTVVKYREQQGIPSSKNRSNRFYLNG